MIALADLGSNAVRLVIYGQKSRAPEVVRQEKELCHLGRDLAQTGRLYPPGRQLALKVLARYAEEARRHGVGLEVMATEAIRRAVDGKDFVEEIRRKLGVRVEIITGAREAKLIGLGALYANPEIEGLVADLGGGSLELVEVGAAYRQGVGRQVSLPLGTLSGHPVKGALINVPWLADSQGRTLVLGGGAWRMLGRLYMRETGYPLEVVDQLTVSPREFSSWCRGVTEAGLARRARFLEKDPTPLPYAAALLRELVKVVRPRSLLFTASGLREGALYSRLSAAERRVDPLVAYALRVAEVRPTELQIEGDRLLVAAWLLCQKDWAAVRDVLLLPVPGLPHGERAFLALVVATAKKLRLTADVKKCVSWLEDADIEAARTLGRALA